MNDTPTTKHPKAFEAEQRAFQRRLTRAVKKNRIGDARQSLGVRFLSVGKYTICYHVLRKDVIELSTAILHPNDRHDKLTGQITALSRYTNGNHTTLRVSKGLTPKEYLQSAFTLL